MKWSEMLEKVIYQVTNEIAFYIKNRTKETDFILTHLRFVLSVLLTEQKRAKGCKYCRMEDGYAWGDWDMITDGGKYYINVEGVWMEIFFCPNCGRDLTEGESV